MTRGLLLVADGVDETQFDYAYHRLREDAVLVDVAAPGGGPVTTTYGHRRDARPIDDLDPARRYDLVIVPGGGVADRLAGDDGARQHLADHYAADGVVCTVGEGVRVLVELDLLADRLATGPGALVEAVDAAGARPTDEAVTVDGPLVTVRDTDALPYGIAAALGNVVIRQDHADAARDRPAWPGGDGR